MFFALAIVFFAIVLMVSLVFVDVLFDRSSRRQARRSVAKPTSSPDGYLFDVFSVDTFAFNRAMKFGEIVQEGDLTAATRQVFFTNDETTAGTQFVEPDNLEYYVGRRLIKDVRVGDGLTHNLFDPKGYFGTTADLREIQCLSANPCTLISAPDRTHAVAFGFGSSFVFDISTGTKVEVFGHLELRCEKASHVAWSPDNRTIAVLTGHSDHAVALLTFGQMEATLVELDPSDWSSATSVCFSHDGQQLLVGYAGGTVRLVDIATGEVIDTLSGPSGLFDVASLADGKTVIAVGREHVVYWKLDKGERTSHPLPLATTKYGPKPAYDVAISVQGRLAATGCDHSDIVLWELLSGKVLRVVTTPLERNRRITVSPDGAYMASWQGDHEGHTVYVVDTRNGQHQATFQLKHRQHWKNGISSVAISSDNRMVITSDRNSIRTWLNVPAN